jgi:hypothetical protein
LFSTRSWRDAYIVSLLEMRTRHQARLSLSQSTGRIVDQNQMTTKLKRPYFHQG